MMLIFIIIVLIFVGIGYYAKVRRGRWSTDKFGVFMDGQGNYRYIPKDTGTFIREFAIPKKVYFSKNGFGECVIKDVNTDLEILNCDFEEAKENEAKAKANGKTFFIRCENENCKLGTHEYENARGIRYCKVDSCWERYGEFDENKKYIKGDYYVKRAIRYSNEELGVRDHRGVFYYKIGDKQIFDSPDEETIKLDNKIFGEDKARLIEQAMMDDANKKIDDYRKCYGYNKWYAFQPQHNLEFNVNTTWSHHAMSQTIKNW